MKKRNLLLLVAAVGLLAGCGESSSTVKVPHTDGSDNNDVTSVPSEGTVNTWAEVKAALNYWTSQKELPAISLPRLGSEGEGAYMYEVVLNNDSMVDCFFVGTAGDLVSDYTETLSGSGWYIPASATDYGYECVDESGVYELDVNYDETYDMTTISLYSTEDLLNAGGDSGDSNTTSGVVDTWAEITKLCDDWADAKSVSHIALPQLGSDGTNAYGYSVTLGDSTYADCFYINYEGDLVNVYLQALKDAGWTVPASATDYGYECMSSGDVFELDVSYYSDYNVTELYLYHYADFAY